MKILILLLFFALVEGERGFGPGEQDYGYVTVRKGAHMFWWLYHTTADVADSAERPIVLWLAGGPGGSSCGSGNFLLVGPQDLNLEHRDNNWVQHYNVLFVDNPVGAGFSFVENAMYFAHNNEEIAKDLVEVMKAFYNKLPKFKTTPLYLYGISYGGKMAVDFAKLLYQEIKLGNIEANIKGVSMGNAWISPVDFSLSYAPFLYETGLIDENGFQSIDDFAHYVKDMYDKGMYYHTTLGWFRLMDFIYYWTDGVDIYNILTKRNLNVYNTTHEEKLKQRLVYDKNYNKEAYTLSQLMNGPVKEALGIPNYVVWGSQAGEILNILFPDFTMPVTDSVEFLLNETDIEIHVCNGNMDLIVDTPGVMTWINNLKWKDSQEYKDAPRVTIWVNNTMEGYKRQGGRMNFYWINVAGHDAISENPAATRVFMEAVTGF